MLKRFQRHCVRGVEGGVLVEGNYTNVGGSVSHVNLLLDYKRVHCKKAMDIPDIHFIMKMVRDVVTKVSIKRSQILLIFDGVFREKSVLELAIVLVDLLALKALHNH